MATCGVDGRRPRVRRQTRERWYEQDGRNLGGDTGSTGAASGALAAPPGGPASARGAASAAAPVRAVHAVGGRSGAALLRAMRWRARCRPPFLLVPVRRGAVRL